MCEAFSRSINSKALAFAKMNGVIVTQLDERCQPESSRIFVFCRCRKTPKTCT